MPQLRRRLHLPLPARILATAGRKVLRSAPKSPGGDTVATGAAATAAAVGVDATIVVIAVVVINVVFVVVAVDSTIVGLAGRRWAAGGDSPFESPSDSRPR